jgi:vancomycin resistance protein YoaR
VPESRTLTVPDRFEPLATREYTSDHLPRIAARRKLRRRRRMRAGLIAIAVVVPLVVGAQWLLTRGEIAPGISVAGVDVGGMSRDAARAKLVADLGAALDQPLRVRAGNVTANVVPARMGITVDVERTLDRAFAASQGTARLLPYGWSRTVNPVVELPTALELPASLRALEHRPKDARPIVGSDGAVTVVPARSGVRFDDAGVLHEIAAAAMAGESSLTIAPHTVQPSVQTADAQRTADLATAVLAHTMTMTWHGAKVGTLTRDELAPLLEVQRQGAGYALALAGDGLRQALAHDTASITKPARDATWRTDGTRARIVPARPGREVDPAATSAAIVTAAENGTTSAAIVVAPTTPDRTTAEAQALGIRRRITTVTTDLGDSSANRIYNVGLMATILDGQVIKPGERFSFNQAVGPRTPQRGFKEGQAIVGGLLVPSIGGGVCQVATTVFDSAFYAGLPINYRVNHVWYISHYSQGMDATVSDGGPDLVFTNDSPYGILIRASSTASTMTVSFYSTSRGIQVEKITGPDSNPTQPTPRYIRNPALKGTEMIRKTIGVPGFSVTVQRIVRQNGKVIRRDSFVSNYHAEQIIYVVGAKFVPTDGRPVETAPPDFTF